MTFADHIARAIASVEVENVDCNANRTGEKMATMSELNLVALFQYECTVFYNLVRKHIHHLDFLSYRSNYVESIWMKSYCSGLFSG